MPELEGLRAATGSALSSGLVSVAPGTGVVLRGDGVILVVPEPLAAQLPALRRLLALCQHLVQSDGRRLVRQVAGLLAEVDPDLVPGFGLAVSTEQSIVVLLHGDVELIVEGPLPVSADGRRSLAWNEQVIDEPFERLTLAAASVTAATPQPRQGIDYDLIRGTVPGSGVAVRGSAVPALPVPAGHAPRERGLPAPPDQTRAIRVEVPSDITQVHAFQVTATSITPPSDALPSRDGVLPLVEGLLCPRGHFNDPKCRYCTRCGSTIERQTQKTVVRPRPALGILEFDDGSVLPLDCDYVIGREPEAHEAVRSGQARPLPLSDDVNGISRAHAALRINGWHLLLTDLGSANGTFTHGGDGNWTALVPQEPSPIPLGTHVRVGQRTMIVRADADHDPAARAE